MNRKHRNRARDTTCSPTVLMTTSNNNTKNNNRQVCRNFQRGACSFGERCSYLYVDSNGNRQSGNNITQGSPQQWSNMGSRNVLWALTLGFPPVVYGPMDAATALPRSFNAMTIYGNSSWCMDTGTTSYLASDVGGFSSPAPPWMKKKRDLGFREKVGKERVIENIEGRLLGRLEKGSQTVIEG
nr:hybrid signal transduction histidine kinase M [Tanacetum cinerariifolium]